MARKKRRRRTSWLTKGINIGILLLAFSPALRFLIKGDWRAIVGKYTGDLALGLPFNKQALLEAYGPLVAAIVLKKGISMVRRMARV